MNRSTLRRDENAAPVGGTARENRAAPRRAVPPATVWRLIVAAMLLISIAQTVAISQHVLATLGDATNTLYSSALRQLQVTTFLRVAVAAIAFWLVVLRRRAGYTVAVGIGVVTVVLYTISLTTPTDPGPSLAPAWLYALGLLAAAVMTLGGALGMRRTPPAR